MRSDACLWLPALAAVMLAPAAAAENFFVYDMTTATDFTGVYLAPAGTERWSGNQALNDKDHALDTSERLTLTGLRRGRYDVKLVDRKGRTCIKRNVDLTEDTSFDLRDADLAACR